jgi:hypothetical protein
MTAFATGRRQRALTCLRAPTAFLRYPFLAPGPRHTPIIYRGREKGRPFFLHVGAASPDIGLATQADGDVLIYAVTRLMDRLNSGVELEGALIVRSGELLRGLGRSGGGRQHMLLDAQIARLNATMVSTNLRGTTQCFTLIERVERVSGASAGWRLHLPTFLIEEVRARRILQISSAAVHLRGLERRVYGWARTYVGMSQAAHWDMPLDRAHASAGSEDLRRRFRSAIRAIITRNRLPDYALQWVQQDRSACIRMTRRDAPAPAAVTLRVDADGGSPGPEDDPFDLGLQWPDAANRDGLAPVEELCLSELIGPSAPLCKS